MDAVVLVGGFGTRLRSVVTDVPKPLAPINGRPFLDLLFEQLTGFSEVESVVLATGYMGDRIGARYVDLRRYNVPVSISQETEPLGTGGALLQALRYVRSEHLLVLNGDSYVDFDLQVLQRLHWARQASVTLTAVHVPDAARFGRVRLSDSDDRVLGFEEKNGRHEPGWINAGCYLLRKDSLPPWDGRRSSFETDVLPDLLPRTFANRVVGRFIDIGVPETYAAAADYLSRDAGVEP